MLLAFIAAKAHCKLLLSLLSSQSPRAFCRVLPQPVSPQPVPLPGVLPAQGKDSVLVSVEFNIHIEYCKQWNQFFCTYWGGQGWALKQSVPLSVPLQVRKHPFYLWETIGSNWPCPALKKRDTSPWHETLTSLMLFTTRDTSLAALLDPVIKRTLYPLLPNRSEVV